MIYTAILVACGATLAAGNTTALAGPIQCVTHEMVFEDSAIPYAGFLEAQNQAAQWLEKHPDLKQKSLTLHPGRSA